MSTVLEVRNLQVSYYTESSRARALAGVDLRLEAGQKLGLVGESGSGKSTMALAMMRMIKPPGRIEAGNVIVDGTDLTQLSDDAMLKARLSKIAYIPQGAMNSLNPVMRVRDQMGVALRDYGIELTQNELEERITALLARVGLPPQIANMYPHELSGGIKQRVVIAIAISLNP